MAAHSLRLTIWSGRIRSTYSTRIAFLSCWLAAHGWKVTFHSCERRQSLILLRGADSLKTSRSGAFPSSIRTLPLFGMQHLRKRCLYRLLPPATAALTCPLPLSRGLSVLDSSFHVGQRPLPTGLPLRWSMTTCRDEPARQMKTALALPR